MAARWLARVDGVSGQLRLGMLIMTGLSTATLTLRQYGHGRYAWPLIGVTGFGMLVFTYLYAEGGVWNQVARDRQDLSANYAGPTIRINSELISRAILAGERERELTEEERQAIKTELDPAWDEFRDGVTIND